MTSPLPLSGIRVLEFGHVAAGPVAGLLLADLGADVVKIEPPNGDGMRQWPPFHYGAENQSYSLNFASLNRNKRSICADLRVQDDKDMVWKLVRSADVLIENFRPGVMERLGFGFSQVSPEHPGGIIYCSITGYGTRNERSLRGAYDVVVQAASGVMSVTGEPDGAPVKCGVPIGDFVPGLYAALSIAAAVAARGITGRARSLHLDCSMTQCLVGISSLQTSEFWGTGSPPSRLGSAHPRNAPYRAFEAKDAAFVVAAGNDDLWRRFCEVIGMPELIHDSPFASQVARARNQDALFEVVAPRLRGRSAQEWIGALETAGVPCGRINSFDDVLSEEGLLNEGFVRSLQLPVGGRTHTTSYPVMVDGWEFAVTPPPALGEDRLSVLTEWLGDDLTLQSDVQAEQ